MNIPEGNIYEFTEDDGDELTVRKITDFMLKRLLEF